PTPDPRPLDVVVVGAGIAGMTCASFLARAGRRVLVLEHNHQAGGLMGGFRRKGYVFDAGDQSFEQMGIVFPLLEQLGMYDPAEWKRARYRIRMPAVDVVVEDLESVRDAFIAAHPDRREEFEDIFDLHLRTGEAVRRVVESGTVPHVRDDSPGTYLAFAAALAPHVAHIAKLVLDEFGPYYGRTMRPGDVADLLARCGYTRMDMFVASAFWHLWAHDYWHPNGGLQALFDRWVERFRGWGGEVLFRRDAVRFLVESRRVRGVQTRDGERFDAPVVVYCGDLKRGLLEMLGPEWLPEAMVERLRGAAMSDALAAAYVGLRVGPETMRERLRAAHTFYFPSWEAGSPGRGRRVDFHSGQFVEVTCHSIDDAAMAPHGCSSVVVQAFSDHGWRNRWGTGGGPRGEAYRTLKARVGDELVARLRELVPEAGAEGAEEFRDVGTPLSTERFTLNDGGSSCGFLLNYRLYPHRASFASLSTPVEGLFTAGHQTIWPGSVPMAALSGKIVADRILANRPRRTLWQGLAAAVLSGAGIPGRLLRAAAGRRGNGGGSGKEGGT
ncbi:MAG: NAD(P)/FAD-dependent oxidoreductase, partial [Myxococcota bacterium]|nr:NAD(P)/FAD-dependent oxidoreductase [Myxococcota bacterium]